MKLVGTDMKRHSSSSLWLICFSGIVAALLSMPRFAQAQQTMFAGVVIDVNCSAELMEADSQTAKALTVGKSGGRPLIDGERLRCKGPGSMTVVLAEGRQIITKDKGWVPVRQGKILQKMSEYAEPASTRGKTQRETIFMSPPDDGTVEIQHLVVRWNASAVTGDVTLTLAAQGSEQELWCLAGYPGKKGLLDSEDLRRGLASYRERGSSAPLILKMTDSSGSTHEVSFSVLAASDEEKLRQLLQEWASRDALVRGVGRASTFSAFGLYVEAAEEYESALREAPNSSLLLQLTAEAERRTGNSIRADELTQKRERVVAKSG